MAMIDYGAIAFKNGKCISTDMFTPMIDTTGWSDIIRNERVPFTITGADGSINIDYTDAPTYMSCYSKFDCRESTTDIDGNYFVCIGDEEYTVAFYKNDLMMFSNPKGEDIKIKDEVFFGFEDFHKWKYWSTWFGGDIIKVKPRRLFNGVTDYVCTWTYKGDKYKVYFGYGIDYGFYKECGTKNEYGSIIHNIHKLKYKINNLIRGKKHD